MKRVQIAWSSLLLVMEDRSWDASHYLDLRNGEVHTIESEYFNLLERAYGEQGLRRDADFGQFEVPDKVGRRSITDWEKEVLTLAHEIQWDTDGRFLEVGHIDSQEFYRFMADFAGAVESSATRGKLLNALESRKPFRSFKDTVEEFPEVREEWFKYEEEKIKEYAIQWLKEKGVEPINV